MNKKIYWIGLPVCFVLLVAGSYLIPKTYKSTFVIAKELEQAPKHEQVLNLNKNENYDLGVVRTMNAFDRFTYQEMLKSDKLLYPLLDAHVSTLDGGFDGTYYEYCLIYLNRNKKINFYKILHPGEKEVVYSANENPAIHWTHKTQESIIKGLYRALKVEIDNQAELVTITCTMQDPLVATMMAEAVHKALIEYIEDSQREKMQQALDQLSELAAEAKSAYMENPSRENETIYLSFARQQVIYKSQMLFTPSIVTIAEPNFSYYKAGPSRIKVPLGITLLIGLILWAWDKRREIVAFFHED